MKQYKWTQRKLDILYECWKNGATTKERIPYIEGSLPKVPLPIAISVMRKLARTDSKWIKWTTRKSNEKEKEKVEKQQLKERKLIEKESRKKAREEKREILEEKKKYKDRQSSLRLMLDDSFKKDLQEKISPEFFFCSDVQQYVCNNACIFRVFSEEYEFMYSGPCLKCKRMDKHISKIEELVDDRKAKAAVRKNGPKRNKASKDGEVKIKKAPAGEETP
jgi:hypothetical protein